ncbi:HAMP domain-containing protein [Bradyrhizobium sp. USDA 377]
MLNRLTVSALLQAVIAITSVCVVVVLSLTAYASWDRLKTANRISQIADASADLFKAMHNLRTDRSTTNRLLNATEPMDAEIEKYLRAIRDAEMPAMAHALELLPTMEFPQSGTLVPELARLYKSASEQQKQFWEEVVKPKDQRRAGLPKEYMETTQGLLDTLDKLSNALAATINHQDAAIDQLLSIKQNAWLLRNTAGEASLIISLGLNSGRIAPEARLAYTQFVGGTAAIWKALELSASGMELPPALSSAMAAAKTAYFDPQYLALRDRLANTLANGEKAEMTANQWTPVTVGRLSSAVAVAETALDAAKSHTLEQRGAALRALIVQLVLLALAVALAVGAIMLVSRRVIRPLNTIRDAMLKVAGGDLSVDSGYLDRKDEIGALAGALEAFKQQATDKLKIEAQERERNAGASARQRAIEVYVGEFEGVVRKTLGELSEASGEMRKTSGDLSAVSRQTNDRVQVAGKASNDASMSVPCRRHRRPRRDPGQRDRRHRAGPGKIRRAYRRGRRPHQHHRSADQSAGAQRHDRGGARRRRRPRICRGRLRSEVAGEPDREGDGRNLRADRRYPEGRRRRHQRDPDHRRHHRRGERGCDRDCSGRAGAGRGDAGDHPQHAIRGAGHQERLGQHHRRQGRRGCRRRGRGQCEARLRDAGEPEPPARPRGQRLPRQDPRGLGHGGATLPGVVPAKAGTHTA